MPALNGSVKAWLGKYLYFSKATICIQGFIFSHSFVNHAIISILVTYLQYNWVHPQFEIAAVVMNVQEGVSDIMVIVLAHISYMYNGGFRIIATTNAAYILGLALLWLSMQIEDAAAATMARIFYGAVVLLALGESGRSATLNEFLDKQYYLRKQKETESTNDKRLERWQERHKEALWNIPWFLGAIVPLFLLNTTWTQIFMISTLAMLVSYILFCFGFKLYFINNKDDPIDMEEKTMYSVEETRIAEQEEPSRVTERWYFWTLMKKLKKKHFLKEILATWLAFLLYSTVKAAGSTFFFEQMSNLENPITNYDPAVYFSGFSSFAKYTISFLCKKLIPKRLKSRAARVRIGCGMACTVLCCVAAWVFEIHRMRKVKRARLGNDTSYNTISTSIFWLGPQFSLLGFMEGLAVGGLIDLFVDKMDDGDDKVMAAYFGSHTTDLVVGIGKLITALSILALRRRWFRGNINLSHLDKYYRLLTFLSVAWFFYYLCVGFYFYAKEESQKSTKEEFGQSGNGGSGIVACEDQF